MTTVLIVCAIIVTLAVAVAAGFLVRTLIQVKNTAREAEILLKNLNQEISTIGRLTGNISAFVERFTSPWVKVGSWLTGIASSAWMNRRKRKSCEAGEEKTQAQGHGVA